MASVDFLDDFRRMSEFGATDNGGVDRQAASPSDGETRAWFADWLRSNGFRVEHDAIGNLFGLLELVPGAPYVLAGSHLDSQPLAGRFDGAYGVLAAAHAARGVRDAVARGDVEPQFNLAVVDWFNEEGCRFKPSMMGSAVFTGLMCVDDALSVRDRSGVSVAEALDAIDGRAQFAGAELAAYAEIHIEQGRRLQDAQATIGVVADTWTARKIQVTVSGEQAHSGAARMIDRRDALYGAARIIVAVRELVDGFAEEHLHTTVSELDVEPNSPVTVAREVRMLIDLRAPDPATLEVAHARLTAEIADIEASARVDVRIESVVEWGAGPFAVGGLEIVEREAEARAHPTLRLSTVAGHDATNLKSTTPTILLFIPCRDGLSHNEGEFAASDDMVAGLEVFGGVLERLVEAGLGESADE